MGFVNLLLRSPGCHAYRQAGSPPAVGKLLGHPGVIKKGVVIPVLC